MIFTLYKFVHEQKGILVERKRDSLHSFGPCISFGQITFTLANWGQGLNILLVHNLEHVTICWIWFFSLDKIFNKMIYDVWYLMFRIKPQTNQIF